jgi:hypothetical protein
MNVYRANGGIIPTEEDNYSVIELPQQHLAHCQFYMDWAGMNPGLRGERPTTDCLCHGTACKMQTF